MRKRQEQHPTLDHAAKEVVRLVPNLIARILRVAVDEEALRFADSAVRTRGFRADQVLLVYSLGDEIVFGWHLEFQAGDDRGEFWRWIQKNAALNEQLKRPILLVIIYLLRGSAPDACEIEAGGARNRHEFTDIRLWEHQDSIRSGELAELAPFLVLWNHERGEEALIEQRELLRKADLPREALDDLIGWTIVLANRFFDSESLCAVFEEEIQMLKDFPEVQQWIAEGELRGERRGELRGDLRTARRICRLTLTDRFGPLSPGADDYLDSRTVDELESLIARAYRVASLSDLGIPSD